MVSDKAVEIVKQMAEQLAKRMYGFDVIDDAAVANQVLTEAGLGELIDAGQAMRDDVGAPPYGSHRGANWDAALAKLGGRDGR